MARIMVVDDNPGVGVLVEKILTGSGHDVEKAISGPQALEKLRSVKPDLILLDIMMPRMDGWQTLKQIRAQDNLKEVPVSMLTAKKLTPETVQRDDIEELVDYIQKPFTKAELISKVNGILQAISTQGGVYDNADDTLQEYRKIVKAELLHESMVSTLKDNLRKIVNPYEAEITQEAMATEEEKIKDLQSRRTLLERDITSRKPASS